MSTSEASHLACPRCTRVNEREFSYCGYCGAPLIARTHDSGDYTVVRSLTADQEDTVAGAVLIDSRLASTVPEAGDTAAGLVVVTLANDGTEQGETFRLQLGEPFDVDGPDLMRPGTFTATAAGLRLDALGGLEGVYVRVRPPFDPVQWRRLRQCKLGTFQAIAPGEILPVGCLAIVHSAFVRIDSV